MTPSIRYRISSPPRPTNEGPDGISPAVGAAEKTAQGAAAAAEAAADNDDFAAANELLKTFAAAMTAIGTAYTDAATCWTRLDQGDRPAERGKRGLEGTKLTTEAATAKKARIVDRNGGAIHGQ